MTPASECLFTAIVMDMPNWSGTPLSANHVNNTTRGNLTDLKKAGLVTTFRSDGLTWIKLTEAGREYAVSVGLGQYLC